MSANFVETQGVSDSPLVIVGKARNPPPGPTAPLKVEALVVSAGSPPVQLINRGTVQPYESEYVNPMAKVESNIRLRASGTRRIDPVNTGFPYSMDLSYFHMPYAYLEEEVDLLEDYAVRGPAIFTPFPVSFAEIVSLCRLRPDPVVESYFDDYGVLAVSVLDIRTIEERNEVVELVTAARERMSAEISPDLKFYIEGNLLLICLPSWHVAFAPGRAPEKIANKVLEVLRGCSVLS